MLIACLLRDVLGMDRQQISSLAHVEHAIAAPVSEARAQQLLSRLALPADASAVDLGCGAGAWLIRLAAAYPGARFVGVHVSWTALSEAHDEAERRGCSARIEWREGDAATVAVGRHDALLCVGASHAFGGLDGTLLALRDRLKPGGRVVLGDTIWEQAPTDAAQEAVEATPDDYPDLAGLVDRVRKHGFEVIDGHVSTLEEWDDYEWAWTGALVRWATQQAAVADRSTALGCP